MISKNIVIGWGRVDGVPKVLLKVGEDEIVLEASRALEVAQALTRSARDVVSMEPPDPIPQA